MALDLRPYRRGNPPTLPGSDKLYLDQELRRIEASSVKVVEVISSVLKNILNTATSSSPLLVLSDASGNGTGFEISGRVVGGGSVVQAYSPATNEDLWIAAKNTGALRLQQHNNSGSPGPILTGAQVQLGGGATGASPAPRITMGAYSDNSDPPSISHLDLYAGAYGFGVSSFTLNYFSQSVHDFYSTNVRKFRIDTNVAVHECDLYSYRAGGTTGVLYLRQDGTRYLYYDGTKYVLETAGLRVGGAVDAANAATGFLLAGGAALARSGNYTLVYDQGGNIALHLGGPGDPANYYRNTNHYFQSINGGATYGSWNSTQLTVSNALSVSGNISGASSATIAGNITSTAGNIDAGASLIARGGAVYLNAALTRYLWWDGSIYRTNGADFRIVGGKIQTDNGYNYFNAGARGAGPFGVAAEIRYTGGGTQYGLVLCDASGVGTTALAIIRSDNAHIGGISHDNTNTAFNTSSDGRLKPEQRSFDAGPIIDALNPIEHNWVDNLNKWQQGLDAQAAYTAYAPAVTPGKGEPGDPDFMPWMIDYSKYVPMILREVKTLRARVTQLEKPA